MHRIIIAMGSDDFSAALENQLNSDYSVIRCFDGNTALELLRFLHPDILLIDLSLPVLDGISVLNQAGNHLPPAVLATTDYDGSTLQQLLRQVKVDRIFKIPCDVKTVIASIRQLAEHIPAGNGKIVHTQIAEILTKLGIPSGRLGFLQLQKAISIFANDPSIAICKELYPLVADSTSVKDGKTAEHTMRSVIKTAWLKRDPEIWNVYFAGYQDTYPPNKAFISRLAQEISR